MAIKSVSSVTPIVAVIVTAVLASGAFGCGAPNAEPADTVVAAESAATEARGVPTFEVDASWPTLPNDWVLGQVASVTVDRRDHVWVLHRPRTVDEGEEANAAPPVLEFDTDGAFINAWGGPAPDVDWPANEHGIHADPQGHLWVGGNGGDPESDDMLLKLTNTGDRLLQIGGRGVSGGNTDTDNLRRPAESFVHEASNEVFVADGYGNRRVIVLDADTGAFKRLWGAFGNEPLDTPLDTPPDDEQGPLQFGTVHGVEVANDGRVYVADRNNSRVQVFTLDGTYLTQGFVNRGADSASTVAGIAFSPDPEQQFLYIADQGNSRIHVVDRETLEVLDSFGSAGEAPGAFQALHHIASDSQGNLYTAEAQRGRRAQKFTFTGIASRD
jgi:DNA-binding beta-propeller fold protein YncE